MDAWMDRKRRKDGETKIKMLQRKMENKEGKRREEGKERLREKQWELFLRRRT